MSRAWPGTQEAVSSSGTVWVYIYSRYTTRYLLVAPGVLPRRDRLNLSGLPTYQGHQMGALLWYHWTAYTITLLSPHSIKGARNYTGRQYLRGLGQESLLLRGYASGGEPSCGKVENTRGGKGRERTLSHVYLINFYHSTGSVSYSAIHLNVFCV